jgi:hypothetical protein
MLISLTFAIYLIKKAKYELQINYYNSKSVFCHCERVYERSNLAPSVTAETLIHANLDNNT